MRAGDQILGIFSVQATQWKDEIESKAPGLSVALYHGKGRQDKLYPTLLASHDVIITTYNTVRGSRPPSALRSARRAGQAFGSLIGERMVGGVKRALKTQAPRLRGCSRPPAAHQLPAWGQRLAFT